MLDRAIVVAVVAEHLRVKEIRARQLRRKLQRALEHDARAVHVAFLYRNSAKIYPAIGILGVDLGDLLKRSPRPFQIALKEKADAIVVPACPIVGIEDHSWRRLLAAARRYIE